MRLVRTLEPPYALNQVLMAVLDQLAELVPAEAYHVYLTASSSDVPRLRITRQPSTVPSVGPAYAGLVASTPVQQVPLELPALPVEPAGVVVRESGTRVELRAGPSLAILLTRPPRRPLSPEERALAEEWLRLTSPLVALAQQLVPAQEAETSTDVGRRRAFELLTQAERVLSLLCRLGKEALRAEGGLLAALDAGGAPFLLWCEGEEEALASRVVRPELLARLAGHPFGHWSGKDLPADLAARGRRGLLLIPVGGAAVLLYTLAREDPPSAAQARLAASLGERLDLVRRHREQAVDLARGYLQVLLAAAELLDHADPHQEGHHQKVANLAARIGRALNQPASAQKALYLAGRLHDVGMVAVDMGIPLTPGTLSEQQRQVIRQHPLLGAELVGGLPPEVVPEGVEEAIRQHHEAWNGTGYPFGLAGEDISLAGRILAVAEQFVARLTPRSYRPATPLPEALYHMQRLSGAALDPAAVEALLALYRAQGVAPKAPGAA